MLNFRLRVQMDDPSPFALLRRRLSDQTQVLTKVAIILRREFAENFLRQGRPSQWEALKPSTLAAKRMMLAEGDIRGRNPRTTRATSGPSAALPGILIRTGLLRESYTHRGSEGNIHQVSDGRKLEVGSTVPYGRWHEEGTRGGKVIVPVKAKVLRWYGIRKDGTEGWCFAKRVVMKPLARRKVLYVSPEGMDKIIAAYEQHLAGEEGQEHGD